MPHDVSINSFTNRSYAMRGQNREIKRVEVKIILLSERQFCLDREEPPAYFTDAVPTDAVPVNQLEYLATRRIDDLHPYDSAADPFSDSVKERGNYNREEPSAYFTGAVPVDRLEYLATRRIDGSHPSNSAIDPLIDNVQERGNYNFGQTTCQNYVVDSFRTQQPHRLVATMYRSFCRITSVIYRCDSISAFSRQRSLLVDRSVQQSIQECLYAEAQRKRFWLAALRHLVDYSKKSKEEQEYAQDQELKYPFEPEKAKKNADKPVPYMLSLLNCISYALIDRDNDLAFTLIEEILPQMLQHYPQLYEALYQAPGSTREERLTRFAELIQDSIVPLPLLLLAMTKEDYAFAHSWHYNRPLSLLSEQEKKRYKSLMQHVERKAKERDPACLKLWNILLRVKGFNLLQENTTTPQGDKYPDAAKKREPLRILLHPPRY